MTAARMSAAWTKRLEIAEPCSTFPLQTGRTFSVVFGHLQMYAFCRVVQLSSDCNAPYVHSPMTSSKPRFAELLSMIPKCDAVRMLMPRLAC